MTYRVLALTVAVLSVLLVPSTQAQGLRQTPSRTVAPITVPQTEQRPADFIVAVVNSDPITNNEVHVRAMRLRAQMEQGANAPDLGELKRQVLERLIDQQLAVD